jgi:hypothetical protein
MASSSCSTTNTVNLDNAQRVDIICRKGDTFSIEVDFYNASNQPINLTSYTWKMEVSESDTSASPVLDSTAFSYSGNSTGTLFVTASAATMLTIPAGLYVYGLQSNVAGVIKTWLLGLFTVNEDVVD